MAIESENNNSNGMDVRVSALEIRLTAIESQLQLIVGAAGVIQGEIKKPGRVPMTKAAKDARKAELVKGGPYLKANLEEMELKDLRFYASAIGTNPFGKKRDEIVKVVLAAQRRKKSVKK